MMHGRPIWKLGIPEIDTTGLTGGLTARLDITTFKVKYLLKKHSKKLTTIPLNKCDIYMKLLSYLNIISVLLPSTYITSYVRNCNVRY